MDGKRKIEIYNSMHTWKCKQNLLLCTLERCHRVRSIVQQEQSYSTKNKNGFLSLALAFYLFIITSFCVSVFVCVCCYCLLFFVVNSIITGLVLQKMCFLIVALPSVEQWIGVGYFRDKLNWWGVLIALYFGLNIKYFHKKRASFFFSFILCCENSFQSKMLSTLSSDTEKGRIKDNKKKVKEIFFFWFTTSAIFNELS